MTAHHFASLDTNCAIAKCGASAEQATMPMCGIIVDQTRQAEALEKDFKCLLIRRAIIIPHMFYREVQFTGPAKQFFGFRFRAGNSMERGEHGEGYELLRREPARFLQIFNSFVEIPQLPICDALVSNESPHKRVIRAQSYRDVHEFYGFLGLAGK